MDVAVSERRVLLHDAAALAVLNGAKTVLRRPIQASASVESWEQQGFGCWTGTRAIHGQYDRTFTCPFGTAGSRLLILEAWSATAWKQDGALCWWHELPRGVRDQIQEDAELRGGTIDGLSYRSDASEYWLHPDGTLVRLPAGSTVPEGRRWQAAAIMPRWAVRQTPTVVSTRPERLQWITAEEAVREGYVAAEVGDPIAGFRMEWDKREGKRPGCSWIEDPWVWRVEFSADPKAERGAS